MLSNYLQILSESLDKKANILGKIESLSNEQSALIADNASLEEIDANMDKKAELINELTLLDEGFESLYNKIKAEIEDKKEEHADAIKNIQSLIAKVMEKSTSIQAIEARNKVAMEKRFAAEKKELSQRSVVSSVAYDYYKTSNKLQAVPPQFLDSKK